MLRTLLIFAFKLAVTGGLIYLVLRDVEMESLAARLGNLSPAWPSVWATSRRPG